MDAGPQISLAWTDNATDETGFIVERSDNGGAFVQLLPAAPAFDGTGIVPPYIDTQVLPGHTYDYRVAAFKLSATSAYSNTASVMIPGIPPIAPDQLDAVFEPGPPPMIALAWQDNSLDETGFVIERSTDGGPFSVLANAVANVTTYDDLSVLGGYTYTYRVAAFNANGTSTWSVPTARASVPPDATPPAAPSNLSATNVLQICRFGKEPLSRMHSTPGHPPDKGSCAD